MLSLASQALLDQQHQVVRIQPTQLAPQEHPMPMHQQGVLLARVAQSPPQAQALHLARVAAALHQLAAAPMHHKKTTLQGVQRVAQLQSFMGRCPLQPLVSSLRGNSSLLPPCTP
jgi:hypothetical protein